MNDIPFCTLTIAVVCAGVGVAVGLFLAACLECAELQHRQDKEREDGRPKEIRK